MRATAVHEAGSHEARTRALVRAESVKSVKSMISPSTHKHISSLAKVFLDHGFHGFHGGALILLGFFCREIHGPGQFSLELEN
jgi:hypothetical protein